MDNSSATSEMIYTYIFTLFTVVQRQQTQIHLTIANTLLNQ